MHKGKASVCHTERGKTKIEGREVANFAVFYDRGEGGGWGEGGSKIQRQQKDMAFLTYSLSKLCSKGLLHKNSVFLYWIYFHCSVFS